MKSVICVLLCLFVNLGFANVLEDVATLPTNFDQCKSYFVGNKPLKRAVAGEIELCYEGYAVLYSVRLKRPIYVSSLINGDELKASEQRNLDRKNLNFFVDPRINPNFSAKPGDLIHTGFDRGHVLGNAMATSLPMQEQTFAMSNVCAQNPQVNREQGAWNVLEKSFRSFIRRSGESAYFIAGCSGEQSILKTGVSVPDDYWMLIVPTNPKRSAWGFIVDNVLGAKVGEKLTSDQLQRRVGITLLSD